MITRAAAEDADPRATFAGPIMLGLVVIGALSFAAFLVLSAFAPQLRQENDFGAHALSKSALGFAGAVDLLERRDWTVVLRRGQAYGAQTPRTWREFERTDNGARFDAKAPLLVLTPPPGDASRIARAVRAARGPVLVIMPKWEVYRDAAQTNWVRREGLMPPGYVGASLNALAGSVAVDTAWGVPDQPRALTSVKPENAEGDARPPDAGKGALKGGTDQDRRDPAAAFIARVPEALPLGAIDNMQTARGTELIPLLTTDSGPVLSMVRGRQVYVLSEPDLLNTHGVGDLDTAYAGITLLEALAGHSDTIVFDLSLHGLTRPRSVMRLAFEPPFLGVTLAALVVALLMAAHAAARFGPPARETRAFALGAASLVENSAALFRMTKREARMGPGYVALTRRLAVKAVGAAPADPVDTDEMLDRLGGETNAGARFSRLAAEAEDVERPSDLLRASQALYAWRRAIAPPKEDTPS